MEGLISLWQFIQDQVLGMKWLNSLIGRGLSAVGLDTASRLGGSLQFFVYDVVKITILLCTLIFIISYIQSFFPPERSRKILGRFKGLPASQMHIGSAGHRNTLLLLLIDTSFYGIYQRGTALGSYIFFSNILAHGGFGKPGASYEHIRRKGCGGLCGHRPCGGGSRRHHNRKNAYGKSGGRLYPYGIVFRGYGIA